MAKETEEKRVTLVIPMKGGKIRIEGIDPMPKRQLRKLPIKSLTSLEGPHILRYKDSYCVVIEFMGCYYQYCIPG